VDNSNLGPYYLPFARYLRVQSLKIAILLTYCDCIVDPLPERPAISTYSLHIAEKYIYWGYNFVADSTDLYSFV